MLNCEYCDYLKRSNSRNESGIGQCMCELTGFVFYKNIEDYEIEYPCSNTQLTAAAADFDDTLEIDSNDTEIAERKLA